MRRREFIAGIGSAVASPRVARSQARMRVVGILMPYPEHDKNARARFGVFRQELARLGWSEGRDVQLDVRWTTDDMDRVRAEVASLVRAKPDVIATTGDRVVAVFRQLTNSIPIVAVASELVGSGFVDSLARPNANITGFSTIEFSVVGKMVDTLRQLGPGLSRVGMIYNPDNPVGAVYRRAFDEVTTQLSLRPIVFPVHGVADIERAIANLAEHLNGGFVAPPDVTVFTLATQVTSLAAQYRVPAVYFDSVFVIGGGLISYGPDRLDLFRQTAAYVNRILKGEKPADLPVQAPSKYELVINLKTAKALGLTIPETLLATADEVID
jgi:putative tryptophan/tyrosine transport system substrate-binding protein